MFENTLTCIMYWYLLCGAEGNVLMVHTCTLLYSHVCMFCMYLCVLALQWCHACTLPIAERSDSPTPLKKWKAHQRWIWNCRQPVMWCNVTQYTRPIQAILVVLLSQRRQFMSGYSGRGEQGVRITHFNEPVTSVFRTHGICPPALN